MIDISIAKREDAKSIALLGRITFGETFGHLFRDKNDLLDYCDKTFSVRKISASLEKSNNIFWIASVNDLPVGYAKLKLDSSSEFIDATKVGQLQKIYVLNDFHSMKIGFKLQNKLLEKAKEKQCNNIWLSVLKSNKHAINFYNKNDFKVLGNHEFQIGKEKFDFLAMGKSIL